jgi:hypothetical protein
MAQTPVSTTPHTKAWMTFDQNLKIVNHMEKIEGREIAAVHTAAMRRSKTLPGAIAKAKGNVKRLLSLQRRTTRLKARLDARLAELGTPRLWHVVMLVTCIEAYLQDVLVDAATVDDKFTRKSEQVVGYADVVAATSLDELANEMRRRWARGWLSDGGPTSWIAKLSKMGAKDYPVDLAPDWTSLGYPSHHRSYGRRRTTDFLKRHPGAAKAVGDRVQVSSRQFGDFLVAAQEFLEPTDRFFLARCPSLRA